VPVHVVKLPHIPQCAEVLVLALAANGLPGIAVGRVGDTAILLENRIFNLRGTRHAFELNVGSEVGRRQLMLTRWVREGKFRAVSYRCNLEKWRYKLAIRLV
jgi:hypothetical protein